MPGAFSDAFSTAFDIGEESGVPGLSLIPSGPVVVTQHGQRITGLDITSTAGIAVNVGSFTDVEIDNCRIRYRGANSSAISGSGAHRTHIENVHIINTTVIGGVSELPNEQLGIFFYLSHGVTGTRIKFDGGSSGVYLLECQNPIFTFLEGHKFRGPLPRGQLIQWNKCTNGLLEDFSCECPNTDSAPQDNLNSFQSPNTVIRRGLIDGNNSPAGVGVIFESNFGEAQGLVEDVDCINQGNGCFSGAPVYDGIFRRCNAKDNHNTDFGRGAPSSNALMYHSWQGIVAGAPPARTRLEDCKYFNPINPGNIYWDSAQFTFIDLTQTDFTPRAPLRLVFPWEVSAPAHATATGAPRLSALTATGAALRKQAASASGSPSLLSLRAFGVGTAGVVAPPPPPIPAEPIVPPAIRTARVYVHDPVTLRRVGQIATATHINRTYALREHGRRAAVHIAQDDAQIANLNPLDGAIISIESAGYPIPWVGRLFEVERDRAAGMVVLTIDAYDAILNERALPTTFSVRGTSAAAVVNILATVNGMNPTGIIAGRIVGGASVNEMRFPKVKAMQALDAIAAATNAEWRLVYMVSEQSIAILLQFEDDVGEDLYRRVTLTEGGNWTTSRGKVNAHATVFAQTVVPGSVAGTFSDRISEAAIVSQGSGFVSGYAASDPNTRFRAEDHTNGVAFGRYAPYSGDLAAAATTRRERVAIREELLYSDVTVRAAQSMLSRRQASEKVVHGFAHTDTTIWKYVVPGNVVHLVSPDPEIPFMSYDCPARVLGTVPREDRGWIEAILEPLQEVV